MFRTVLLSSSALGVFAGTVVAPERKQARLISSKVEHEDNLSSADTIGSRSASDLAPWAWDESSVESVYEDCEVFETFEVGNLVRNKKSKRNGIVTKVHLGKDKHKKALGRSPYVELLMCNDSYTTCTTEYAYKNEGQSYQILRMVGKRYKASDYQFLHRKDDIPQEIVSGWLKNFERNPSGAVKSVLQSWLQSMGMNFSNPLASQVFEVLKNSQSDSEKRANEQANQRRIAENRQRASQQSDWLQLDQTRAAQGLPSIRRVKGKNVTLDRFGQPIPEQVHLTKDRRHCYLA